MSKFEFKLAEKVYVSQLVNIIDEFNHISDIDMNIRNDSKFKIKFIIKINKLYEYLKISKELSEKTFLSHPESEKNVLKLKFIENTILFPKQVGNIFDISFDIEQDQQSSMMDLCKQKSRDIIISNAQFKNILPKDEIFKALSEIEQQQSFAKMLNQSGNIQQNFISSNLIFQDESFPSSIDSPEMNVISDMDDQINFAYLQEKPYKSYNRNMFFFINPIIIKPIDKMYISDGNVQGQISSLMNPSNLISALWIICESKSNVQRIFNKNDRLNDYGAYNLLLSINNQRKQILVDEQFPCNVLNEPYFFEIYHGIIQKSKINEEMIPQEIWPQILTKGLAKICESMSNLMKLDPLLIVSMAIGQTFFSQGIEFICNQDPVRGYTSQNQNIRQLKLLKSDPRTIVFLSNQNCQFLKRNAYYYLVDVIEALGVQLFVFRDLYYVYEQYPGKLQQDVEISNEQYEYLQNLQQAEIDSLLFLKPIDLYRFFNTIYISSHSQEQELKFKINLTKPDLNTYQVNDYHQSMVIDETSTLEFCLNNQFNVNNCLKNSQSQKSIVFMIVNNRQFETQFEKPIKSELLRQCKIQFLKDEQITRRISLEKGIYHLYVISNFVPIAALQHLPNEIWSQKWCQFKSIFHREDQLLSGKLSIDQIKQCFDLHIHNNLNDQITWEQFYFHMSKKIIDNKFDKQAFRKLLDKNQQNNSKLKYSQLLLTITSNKLFHLTSDYKYDQNLPSHVFFNLFNHIGTTVKVYNYEQKYEEIKNELLFKHEHTKQDVIELEFDNYQYYLLKIKDSTNVEVKLNIPKEILDNHQVDSQQLDVHKVSFRDEVIILGIDIQLKDIHKQLIIIDSMDMSSEYASNTRKKNDFVMESIELPSIDFDKQDKHKFDI